MDSPEGSIVSSSSEGCLICYNHIECDQPYAKIDHDKETKLYHPDCLDGWFQEHDIGIVSREKVESYSIYHENQFIEKVMVVVQQMPIDPIMMYNNMPWQPYVANDSYQTADLERGISYTQQPRNTPRQNGRTRAGIFCCLLAVAILIIVMISVT
jgi:hypothetical protein